MRTFTWHEGTIDTLRDVIGNYLETANSILLLEEDGTLPPEQAQALRWAIADAEQVLSDLGEPCDCCREGTYSNPDDMGECFGCHHVPGQHEEYSGPLGGKGVWQS